MKSLSTILTTLLLSSAIGCATDDSSSNPPSECGDGTCSDGETHATCASDCPSSGPTCGDGVCNGDETSSSCATDCPTSGPFCGDGACSNGETSATCATDCPQTACSTQADNCTGETVCVAGSCVAAFGRIYKIVMVDGVMTQNDANGSTWDGAGGLPDPAIRLTLNNTVLGTTAEKQDTLTPVWNECLMSAIPGGSTFKVSVLDSDVTNYDPMFDCQDAPLTAAKLRVHGSPYVTCSGTGALAAAKVRYYFLPQ